MTITHVYYAEISSLGSVTAPPSNFCFLNVVNVGPKMEYLGNEWWNHHSFDVLKYIAKIVTYRTYLLLVIVDRH